MMEQKVPNVKEIFILLMIILLTTLTIGCNFEEESSDSSEILCIHHRRLIEPIMTHRLSYPTYNVAILELEGTGTGIEGRSRKVLEAEDGYVSGNVTMITFYDLEGYLQYYGYDSIEEVKEWFLDPDPEFQLELQLFGEGVSYELVSITEEHVITKLFMKYDEMIRVAEELEGGSIGDIPFKAYVVFWIEKLGAIPIDIDITEVAYFESGFNRLRETVYTEAGGSRSYGITDDGLLWAWGLVSRAGLWGEINTGGNIINSGRPVEIMENVIAVSAGIYHTMAITADYTLWGWGHNKRGQFTTSDEERYFTPILIMEDVISVSVGSNHTVAITSDGVLWTWGNNENGQLGDGTRSSSSIPNQIMENIVFACVGREHTMAIDNNGTLWSWGSNQRGQLGIEPRNLEGEEYILVPTAIKEDVIAASAGDAHSLAITSDGVVWSWGHRGRRDYDNEVADSILLGREMCLECISPEFCFTPMPIPEIESAKAVVAGRRYSMVLDSNGTLWSWGKNYDGQLGDRTKEHRGYPIPIMEGVTDISTGNAHSFAIDINGVLWGWGNNQKSQLGNGSRQSSPYPIQVR